MKEKIRHLIAGKLFRKIEVNVALSNAAALDQLTEEFQNKCLDELRSLNEEIKILEKVLTQLKQ
jgi:hypothetical protein